MDGPSPALAAASASPLAAAPACAPPSPPLGLTLGAIEVGVLLATLLYGAATVQTYLYAVRRLDGCRWIKVFVALVWVIETLHTIFTWMYLYDLSVTFYGDPLGMNYLPWYFGASIMMQAIVGAIVQAFFSYRVQALSKKWWPAVPAYVAQMFRVGLGVTQPCVAYLAKTLSDYHARYTYFVYMILITSAVTDLWNTLMLVVFLGKCKSAYKNTRDIIKGIIIWTVETGLLATIFAIVTLVLWSTMPDNALWLSVNMVYAKLYSNTLLVALDARARTSSDAVKTSSGFVVTRTFHIAVDVAGHGYDGSSVDCENAGAIGLEHLSGTPQDQNTRSHAE